MNNIVKKLNISLKAIDWVEPDEFISSDQIEQDLAPVYDKLKLPYGRIEMQTGIKSRGVYHDKRPSDISALAAKNLFKNSDIDPKSIDLVIHASVCRDFLEPSTVSLVHHQLGLRPDCLSFDLSNACLGVVSAIQVVSDMLNMGTIKNALIVTGENAKPLLSKTIETLLGDASLTRKSIKKYFANFTIGSAGVAMLLTGHDPKLPELTSISSLSDTSSHKLCQGDSTSGGLVMETNSELLLKKGVALAKSNWDLFTAQVDCEFDHIVCHQVGIQHQNFLYDALGLDKSKDISSFTKYGNTGSAALPLTLARAVKENKFKSGDQIALLGIGSGLHTTMLGVKWN